MLASEIHGATTQVLIAKAKPPVTTALVGINVAVFAAMTLTGVSPLTPTTAQLLKWGANWGPYSLGPQPWRMLTSNYLHVGILHIGLNMWCLWNLGYLAERIFDPWTYVLIYTATGLAGSVASLWWHPMVVGAGASGAIFGLAGALISALYLGHLPIPKEALRGTLKSIVTFAGYNLLFGAVGRGIDNSAHVGGLVSGLALGALMSKHLIAPAEIRRNWRSATLVVAVILLFGGFRFVSRTNAYVVPLQQGVDAFQKRQFANAIPALEQAAAQKTNHDTLFLLADAYLQNGDYAKAEPVLRHILQVTPADNDARFNLGLVDLKLGNYDDAIANLTTFAQHNPRDATAQQALGEAYEAKNMPLEARTAFQKASELRKNASR
jgi:membrane associated rhomboid family serine protease